MRATPLLPTTFHEVNHVSLEQSKLDAAQFWVFNTVCGLIDACECSVVTEREPNSPRIILRVTVPANELGRLIGKSGRNIRAMRLLLQGIGMKLRLQLDVQTDRVGPQRAAEPLTKCQPAGRNG